MSLSVSPAPRRHLTRSRNARELAAILTGGPVAERLLCRFRRDRLESWSRGEAIPTAGEAIQIEQLSGLPSGGWKRRAV